MTKDYKKSAVAGAVAVIGGGVGGMQAALDLADSGIKVYLIDTLPSIGGMMAQLDKTFPTNDCSMCILAPRLVGTQRHPNIEILSYTDVKGLSGTAGNFTLAVNRKAKFVHDDLCVGCGDCWEKCPVKNIPNEFDYGLSKRTAIYRMFPQAIPNIPVIDKAHCLRFKTGKCGICRKVCKANAVDYEMKDTELKLNVAGVVLAPGYTLYDSALKQEFGYGRHKNVISSLEFERILNASGPYCGEILRPSDKKHPHKVAFIQCVGSRDSENNYCSSVCCMYATKEALIAMEHAAGLECSIFHIDIRAFGKGFDSYYERAKQQGVRYIRCRPSAVKESPKTHNLSVKYYDESGKMKGEEFDMVVLSAGLRPPKDSASTAGILGLELNNFGFCKTAQFEPVKSTREGVFVCGPFSEPKDIPETVMEASAAASKALSIVYSQRGTLVKPKTLPAEKDVSAQEPRVGVFICHCGANIAGVVRVPEVVEYSKTLPNVAFAGNTIYACANDSLEKIKAAIKENNLNRLVVAACTPRTHEPLFRSAMQESGLNPYLFEMANIRDQNSWVHMKEPEKATQKAKELVKMAVAKARKLQPLKPRTMKINPSVLIIGGGLSAMTSALDLAACALEVHLVEREKELGGNFRKVKYLLDAAKPADKLAAMVRSVTANKNIKVHLNSHVNAIDGSWGNFKTTIKDGSGKTTELKHGVIILATGATEYKPVEYLYGKDKNVITQLELESALASGDFKAGTVVMIQCVGSRNTEHPYCSRLCCSQAVKNALAIKEKNPETEVYVLYRDMRTYGFREEYYTRAREKGVVFMRFEDADLPEVKQSGGKLAVTVKDAMLKAPVRIEAQKVVLSTGIAPNSDNAELAQLLKVPVNQDGFFLEAHMKLRPVDFASDGVFLCGLCHWPKDSQESIAQAGGAAARAAAITLKETVELDAHYAVVIDSNCDGCALCVNACPYKAITLLEYAKDGMVRKIVEINPGLCKGCGVCQATCPKLGVRVQGFALDQLYSMIDSLFETEPATGILP